MVDFAAIGHVTTETIVRPSGEWKAAGGPLAYVVLTAKKLGKKVKVVTKVGEDISDEHVEQLKAIGVDLDRMIAKGAKTTRIYIDLRGEERKGEWLDFCEEIKPIDVVDLPDAVLINPAMGAAVSASLLETIGPTIDAPMKEITRRAEHIFDRIERL